MLQDLLPFTPEKETICLHSVDARIAAYPHASVLAEITVSLTCSQAASCSSVSSAVASRTPQQAVRQRQLFRAVRQL